MNYQQRYVPFDYGDLLNAVRNGEFPAERHWLDFKREFYARPAPSGRAAKTKSKAEVHLELARDLASLAVRGGYVIFGVEEDKASHMFTVVDMPLPVHLDQTVDQVARALPRSRLRRSSGSDGEGPLCRRHTHGSTELVEAIPAMRHG